jgi:hypothetical protein
MLILTIKRKWMEKIRSGEKREEFRDISPFYTSRFKSYLPFLFMPNDSAEKAFRKIGADGVAFKELVLRAGYSLFSPAIMVSGRITVGTGLPEWGATPGKEYYILHIYKVEDLLTDAKSYTPEAWED